MNTASTPEIAPIGTTDRRPTPSGSEVLRCYGATPATPPPADDDANDLHGDAMGAALPGDLSEVAARWAALPKALKAGIVAMVRAADPKD